MNKTWKNGKKPSFGPGFETNRQTDKSDFIGGFPTNIVHSKIENFLRIDQTKVYRPHLNNFRYFRESFIHFDFEGLKLPIYSYHEVVGGLGNIDFDIEFNPALNFLTEILITELHTFT